MKFLLVLFTLLTATNAFVPLAVPHHTKQQQSALFLSASSEVAAPSISGEELETMMTEWDQPLIIDAYATWCGPCILMSPEFEACAQELKGKVRMVKVRLEFMWCGRLVLLM